METRSAKSNENFQSDLGDSSTSTSLDENLWGTLQHHINLAENVYSKLPFEEFFHLRGVCKDWYVIACTRLGLKEPIHKPFFTLFTKGDVARLDGILTYNASSRSWDWTPGLFFGNGFQVVASAGVVFSTDNKLLRIIPRAYHWNSKRFQEVHEPPPPPPPSLSAFMILGMSVSEEQDPGSYFRSFRVVRGSEDHDTQVYESGVWQTKPCRVPKPETSPFGVLQLVTGCADCDGRIYITTEYTREIFVYDIEKARWSSLRSPCDWVSHQNQHFCLDTLGVWNRRVYDMTCDFQSVRNKNWSLQVWELVDETLHKWKVYDCMPKGLCSWLRCTRGFLPLRTKAEDISIQASFCGDFMLVYSWDFSNGSAGRFCLFNMATKNWQKLNIAAGDVAVDEAYASKLDDSEGSDGSDDFI